MGKHPALTRAADKLREISEIRDVNLLVCDRCGHDMMIRQTQVTEDPLKNDIRIKCPYDPDNPEARGCGWWTRHGIPLTREQHDREMEDREHRLVDAVNTEWEENTVKERLRDLGYME